MGSIELARVEARARRAYELSRLRQATFGVLPIAVVVAVATFFTHRPASALAFGALTVFSGAAMLFYGREPQRAVLPGVAAGLMPLTLALCANHVHACGPEGCTTLCLPACIVGGVASGLVVASIGHRRGAGLPFWLSASGLALLTGAMGCTCVGYSGVAGLVVGFALGFVPSLLRKRA
jgi:hypothetical protein